jgi:hypothetical protein
VHLPATGAYKDGEWEEWGWDGEAEAEGQSEWETDDILDHVWGLKLFESKERIWKNRRLMHALRVEAVTRRDNGGEVGEVTRRVAEEAPPTRAGYLAALYLREILV